MTLIPWPSRSPDAAPCDFFPAGINESQNVRSSTSCTCRQSKATRHNSSRSVDEDMRRCVRNEWIIVLICDVWQKAHTQNICNLSQSKLKGMY
jgi:hypothetical protein